MSKKQPELITQEARYRVRLNYVLFPIEFRELRRALAKNGYELSSAPGIPPAPARIRFTGDIARKGEITVMVESDMGEIGVVGRSLQESIDAFEELARVIDSEIDVNLHKNVSYYACSVHYKIDTGKIPRKEISKTVHEDYIEKFNQVLGENLTTFSVRLAPKDAIPNQESWFDIAIEPDMLNKNFYHVGVVFRDPDKRKTEAFVSDLENNLLKLIGVIEA